MRVPISWLREYVDLPASSQAIADRLASIGFPVEEIVKRPAIRGVVVGKIVAQEKHPNADRLQVCTIDTGGAQTLTIATAATNTAAGNVIPVATIGAVLPHLTIEPRKMRGIDSQGMLCSPDELGLIPEWFEDGIMQLDPDTPLGADVVELFGLAEDGLEIEITSNRVDAMSVIGLARELAASYGAQLRLPSFENPGIAVEDAALAPKVTIESTDCTRFVAQRFDRIRVAPAPAWMRIRLALAGQRPINNLVDISNYVMLEVGQPLHFYDATAVEGGEFIVRDARPGEKLVTLDDAEHELNEKALVIADPRRILGLAGLMGGSESAVRPETTALFLESANFRGSRIRRMSMALGFRTEGSSRHEKALAPALTNMGAARAAALLAGLGARAFAPHAFGEPIAPNSPIPIRAHDVRRILGIDLTVERIAQHLGALGCDVTLRGETLDVTPPLWRRDIAITADLVEEVARMEGYDAIEAIVPSVPPHDISSAQYDLENRLADTLASLGYHEILTYSMHGRAFFERARMAGIEPSHRNVEILNPLSEDQRYLRYTLAPAMLEYFGRIDKPIRTFEIAHVFMNDDTIVESPVLTFGFSAEALDEPPWRDTNFLRLKGDCEALLRIITGRYVESTRDARNGLHPGKSAVLLHDGREVANFGRLDPRLEKAYGIRLPAYLCNIYIDALPDYAPPVYHPPSKYPSTYRDLAVIVSTDVSAAQVTAVIRSAAGALCTGARAFDEYRGPQAGEGRKSLAVRVTLQRPDATITDEEADAAIGNVLARLRTELHATIRE